MLQKDTGVVIATDFKSKPDQCVVTITGPEAGIQKAMEILGT